MFSCHEQYCSGNCRLHVATPGKADGQCDNTKSGVYGLFANWKGGDKIGTETAVMSRFHEFSNRQKATQLLNATPRTNRRDASRWVEITKLAVWAIALDLQRCQDH